MRNFIYIIIPVAAATGHLLSENKLKVLHISFHNKVAISATTAPDVMKQKHVT
jgi:hypothetical protein